MARHEAKYICCECGVLFKWNRQRGEESCTYSSVRDMEEHPSNVPTFCGPVCADAWAIRTGRPNHPTGGDQ